MCSTWIAKVYPEIIMRIPERLVNANDIENRRVRSFGSSNSSLELGGKAAGFQPPSPNQAVLLPISTRLTFSWPIIV